jgi:hypothetical protein
MGQESGSANANKRYSMGDVGTGARVVQGDNNAWSEGLRLQPGGGQLTRELADLLDGIKADATLDPDDRELAIEKTQAVANALPEAAESPDVLRKALRDAKHFFSSTAQWLWERLRKVLTSEPAHELLKTITDATARAAIESLLGMT